MSYSSWRISFQSSEEAAKSAYMQVHDLYLEKESLQRQLAQAQAVIAEQKVTLDTTRHARDVLYSETVEQSELIEKLAKAVKCCKIVFNGGGSGAGWSIAHEAITAYNKWKENK